MQRAAPTVVGFDRGSLRLHAESAGASTIRCVFVPPKPNELTPAIRGRSPRGQAMLLRRNRQPRAAQIDVRIERFEIRLRRDLARAAS